MFEQIMSQMRELVRTKQYVMTLHAEEENNHGICAMKQKEGLMVCDVCGKEGARIRRIARTYGKGKALMVIEDIPVITCPNCGESYLTAETLHEIERIKLHRQSFFVERPIGVASFA